jgi:hypothetical protein
MPPITRNQLKKCSHKTEPYSKENRPSDKRNALSDLVIDNVSFINLLSLFTIITICMHKYSKYVLKKLLLFFLIKNNIL